MKTKLMIKLMAIVSLTIVTACQSNDRDSALLGGNSVNNGIPGQPRDINCSPVRGSKAAVTITGSVRVVLNSNTNQPDVRGALSIDSTGVNPQLNPTISVVGQYIVDQQGQVVAADFVPTSTQLGSQAVSAIHIDFVKTGASYVKRGKAKYPTNCVSAAVTAAQDDVISLEPVTAGVDYPTDRPTPSEFADKKILVIGTKRIIVPNLATLDAPQAGIEFPTDISRPDWAQTSQVLAVDTTTRILIKLEAGQAGVDWIFATSDGARRIPVADISAVIRAVAGVDYPQDGGQTGDHDYMVVVTAAERIKL